MQHTKYIAIGPLVLQKKIYEEVLPLWAWRPSRSYDPDPPNKLSFPRPIEASNEILLESAQWHV